MPPRRSRMPSTISSNAPGISGLRRSRRTQRWRAELEEAAARRAPARRSDNSRRATRPRTGADAAGRARRVGAVACERPRLRTRRRATSTASRSWSNKRRRDCRPGGSARRDPRRGGGDAPGLDDLFRQAVPEAGETPVGLRAQIGLTPSRLRSAGRWSEAVERAREAVSARASLWTMMPCSGSRSRGSAVMKYLDSRPDGSRELAEALALEQTLGRLPASVYESPQMWQAAALLWSDDLDGARLRFSRSGSATASERGDDLSAFQTMRLLAHVELQAGNWRAGREICHAALEQAELLGYEYGRPVMLGALAGNRRMRGGAREARTLGTEALATLTGFGDRLWSRSSPLPRCSSPRCAPGNAVGGRSRTRRRSPTASRTGANAGGRITRETRSRRSCWPASSSDARRRVEALRRAGNQLALPRFLAWAERGEGLIYAADGNLAGRRGRPRQGAQTPRGVPDRVRASADAARLGARAPAIEAAP